jgi:hypothetical protein
MTERMGREDRKDYLSHIMLTKYAEARSQADFTAASIACVAGVSAVWFYKLVGKQFKKLRAQLPGPIVVDETLISKLRKEIAELHTQIIKLKEKYELNIKERLAEAIKHIELLDKENRMLRETVRVLEKRLSDEKLVIFSPTANSTTVPSNEQI